nr:hypothetical protein [Fibrobacterota bacterium]
TLTLPRGRVHLVDTAGLGRPVDGLDELAMERTRRQSELADIRIWVEDGTSQELTGQTGTSQEMTGQTGTSQEMTGPTGSSVGPADSAEADGGFALRIRTKADLSGFRATEGSLAVSNRSRAGLDAFRERLDALVFSDRGAGEDIMLTTERQFRAVEAARERVAVALEGMRGKPAIEILAFEVREAAGFLQELLGEISTDEILGKIFSGFCIGK